jgi:peptide/nickel transport system permease protein
LGQSVNNVIFAISILLIPGGARIIRGSVLSIKEQTYVDAARAVGCTNLRIMFRHIFPNTIAPYIILISVSIGGAIITEASLSFLGMGAPPDAPSWGAIINTASKELFSGGLGLALGPGLAIALAVFAFNLLGDALRDTLDPRLRQR